MDPGGCAQRRGQAQDDGGNRQRINERAEEKAMKRFGNDDEENAQAVTDEMTMEVQMSVRVGGTEGCDFQLTLNLC